MKTHNREILIYYHPESRSDRQTVAMAQGISSHVRSYAYGKTPSTETSWRSIIHTNRIRTINIIFEAVNLMKKVG